MDDLYSEWLRRVEDVAQTTDENPQHKLPRESLLRITETQIAIHEQSISQKKIAIRGYNTAYIELEGIIDTLGARLIGEHIAEYREDKEWAKEQAVITGQSIMTEQRIALFDKENRS